MTCLATPPDCLDQAAATSATTANTATTELLARELPFVFSQDFTDPQLMGADADLVCCLLGETQLETPRPQRDAASLMNHLSVLRLRLLTADEEFVLFRRLSFLNWRANSQRVQLHPTRPAKRKIERILQDLDEADRIRRRIIESNSRLVVSIAQRLSQAPEEFEDYVSEGFLILLKAVDRFDFTRGFRFSTYATHSIQRHLFRLSRQTRERRKRYIPTDSDAMRDQAIDAAPEIAEHDQTAVVRELLRHADDLLSEREQRVLALRFGLRGEAPLTLRDISRSMGISKERVRQVQLRGLEKLKHLCEQLYSKNVVAELIA